MAVSRGYADSDKADGVAIAARDIAANRGGRMITIADITRAYAERDSIDAEMANDPAYARHIADSAQYDAEMAAREMMQAEYVAERVSRAESNARFYASLGMPITEPAADIAVDARTALDDAVMVNGYTEEQAATIVTMAREMRTARGGGGRLVMASDMTSVLTTYARHLDNTIELATQAVAESKVAEPATVQTAEPYADRIETLQSGVWIDHTDYIAEFYGMALGGSDHRKAVESGYAEYCDECPSISFRLILDGSVSTTRLGTGYIAIDGPKRAEPITQLDDCTALLVIPEDTNGYAYSYPARDKLRALCDTLGYVQVAAIAKNALLQAESEDSFLFVVTCAHVDAAIERAAPYGVYPAESATRVPRYTERPGSATLPRAMDRSSGWFYVNFVRYSGTSYALRFPSLDALRMTLDATRTNDDAIVIDAATWHYIAL